MCYSSAKQLDLQAIIPAAGLGSRFAPFSKVVPKELLPVINIPAIDFALHELLDAKLSNVKVVISEQKKILADYVSNFSQSLHITQIVQTKPLGLGHAVLSAMQSDDTNTVTAVILPDNILCSQNQPLPEMLHAYLQTQDCCAVILLVEVPMADCFQYGIAQPGTPLTDNIFAIQQIIEKPKGASAPSNLAVMGRYLFSPCITQALQTLSLGINGEYQLTDAINDLINQGKKVLGYKFSGNFFDIGTPKGWLHTNNSFALGKQHKKELP